MPGMEPRLWAAPRCASSTPRMRAEERARPTGYARVPRWIVLEPDLSAGAKLALVAILTFIWHDTDRCTVEVAELWQRAGRFVSERRFQSLLNELVERRFIDRFPDPERPGGVWVTRVLFDPSGARPPAPQKPERTPENSAGGVLPMAPGGATHGTRGCYQQHQGVLPIAPPPSFIPVLESLRTSPSSSTTETTTTEISTEHPETGGSGPEAFVPQSRVEELTAYFDFDSGASLIAVRHAIAKFGESVMDRAFGTCQLRGIRKWGYCLEIAAKIAAKDAAAKVKTAEAQASQAETDSRKTDERAQCARELAIWTRARRSGSRYRAPSKMP